MRAHAFLCFIACLGSAGCTPIKDDRAPHQDADRPSLPEAAPGCAALPGEAAEVYVQAGATGGTGTRDCPLGTIGEGIARAGQQRAAQKVVKIAPGRYRSEAFPIRLLPGISLEGSDVDAGSPSDDTVIEGAGEYAFNVESTGASLVTLVVGDGSGTNSISHLTLAATPGAHYGVVCESGNADKDGAPEPNVILSNVDIHGYTGTSLKPGTAIALAATKGPSGCNLLIRASHLYDAPRGIHAAGCNPYGPVAVELGDGTAEGRVRMTNIGLDPKTSNNGEGLFVSNCVSRVMVRYAVFENSTGGIRMFQLAEAPYFLGRVHITDSKFVNLSNAGIGVGADTTVEDLSRNEFRGISGGIYKLSYPAIGIALSSENPLATNAPPAKSLPRVVRARGNTFVGNDVGLFIRGDSHLHTDFGRSGDPGRNVFHCNSGSQAVPGGDVIVTARFIPSPANSAPTLSFVGNQWDHAPVTVNGTWSNGDDFVSVHPAIVDEATLATEACPGGKELGR